MKQYLIIIMAVVLFGTMTSSCGKKTEETNMANKDSVGPPPPPPTVTIAAATCNKAGSNLAPGLSITGNSSCKTVTITVTDTSGSTVYRWRAYYGATNDSTLVPGNPSGGNSASWSPGSYSVPQYWFPQYTGSTQTPIPPATWTNFRSMNITIPSGPTATAYGIGGSTSENIRIQVQAGGGE